MHPAVVVCLGRFREIFQTVERADRITVIEQGYAAERQDYAVQQQDCLFVLPRGPQDDKLAGKPMSDL